MVLKHRKAIREKCRKLKTRLPLSVVVSVAALIPVIAPLRDANAKVTLQWSFVGPLARSEDTPYADHSPVLTSVPLVSLSARRTFVVVSALPATEPWDPPVQAVSMEGDFSYMAGIPLPSQVDQAGTH